MYIKHISQIWIRLVQCFSIWTLSRSIRYRCGINSFLFCLTNNHNNLEFAIIIWHTCTDSSTSKELFTSTSAAKVVYIAGVCYVSKFVVLARLLRFGLQAAQTNRLKATGFGHRWATKRIEGCLFTVISLLSFGTFLDDKERRYNIASLEIKLSTVT